MRSIVDVEERGRGLIALENVLLEVTAGDARERTRLRRSVEIEIGGARHGREGRQSESPHEKECLHDAWPSKLDARCRRRQDLESTDRVLAPGRQVWTPGGWPGQRPTDSRNTGVPGGINDSLS